MRKTLSDNLFPLLCIIAGTLLMIAAAASPTVADFYVTRIFPLWPATYGRLTSVIPFSVGEWMLIAAVLIVVLFVVSCFVKRLRFLLRFVFRVFGIFFLIMILNCFLLYRCTPLLQQMEKELATQGVSEAAEDALVQLRNDCVERCNALALSLPRDEAGALIVADREVITESARAAVADAAAFFPRLKGYQVRPKPLFFSDFVSQQNMSGYYFPFSMEANFNNVMNPIHLPFTMCHELAHTHGYLREDECNFLAWVACVTSDDPVFEYSGRLNVLYYLDRDCKRALGKDAYAQLPAISDAVRADAAFLSEETKQRIEEHALFRTEDVQKAAEVYVDTTLKVNGIASGYDSYAEVVRLMTTFVLYYPYVHLQQYHPVLRNRP